MNDRNGRSFGVAHDERFLPKGGFVMELGLFVVWMLAGWCGTGPIRLPIPPPPTPNPWILRALGVVGGVAGGWLFASAWPGEVTAIYAASTAVGAVIGSIVVQDLVGLTRGVRG